MSEVEVGKCYRTPWEPSGIVKVLEIEEARQPFAETVRIQFVGDHPNGYKHGSFGRYHLSEMRPLRDGDDAIIKEPNRPASEPIAPAWLEQRGFAKAPDKRGSMSSWSKPCSITFANGLSQKIELAFTETVRDGWYFTWMSGSNREFWPRELTTTDEACSLLRLLGVD